MSSVSNLRPKATPPTVSSTTSTSQSSVNKVQKVVPQNPPMQPNQFYEEKIATLLNVINNLNSLVTNNISVMQKQGEEIISLQNKLYEAQNRIRELTDPNFDYKTGFCMIKPGKSL